MSDVIDFDGPVPAYRQLADILRRLIESGKFPPGRPIPSKRTAGQEYGVGGHTYDRAVTLLRDEGLIETVKGKGHFVRPTRR